MVCRIVACCEVPDTSGKESDDCAHPEGRAPSVVNHEIRDERRREARTRPDSGEDPAIGDTTFADRNPASDELIRRRVNDCLSGPEKKSDGNKKKQCATDVSGHKRG